MATRPKYSLIIPVYNVERFLPACLDSILEQTYNNFEIVLVNDGSTDQSLEICNEYQRANPNREITVVSQENRGLLATRCVGAARAQGEYFWVIDSDDAIAVDALEIIDESLSQTQADMAFFDYSLRRDFSLSSPVPLFPESRFFKKDDRLELLEAYCCGYIYPVVTKVVRRECWPPGDLYEKYHKLNNGEDQLLDIAILDRVETAVYIRRALYYYRQNASSITGEYRAGIWIEQAKVWKEERKAISAWSGKDADGVLLSLWAKGSLRNAYFNVRKGVTCKNYRAMFDEFLSLEDFHHLLEHTPSLRIDQRLLFHLIKKNWYTLAWLYCAQIRLMARMAKAFIRSSRKA